MRLVRFHFALVFLAPIAGGLDARAGERILTKAIEVRSLSAAEAERGLKAHLRGVVVYVEGQSAVFLQDETSTTFFRLTAPNKTPQAGDDIEIDAKTRMGLYLPGLEATSLRVLGRRELPPGIPVQYDDLHFSRYHYQRVVVEGIVRSVTTQSPTRTLVRIAMGSRVIEARVEAPLEANRALVGCRVRATGLAAGLINTPRRQMVQAYLRVLGWHEIDVIAPAVRPDAVPQISAEELLAFRVTGHGEQRVRVEGVVSATPGDDLAYLVNGPSAFAVRFSEPVSLQAGDELSIIGFPTMDRFSASVVDAEVFSRQPGAAPAPTDVASLDALYGEAGRFDGHLVRVTVSVRDVLKTESGLTLLVESGRQTIHARLPAGAAAPPIGSRITLTGICQVDTVTAGSGFASRPALVSLRARTPADIVVVSRPSWWTPRRLASVLAALGGVVLLAGLWIALLRRQVRQKTEALRRRIESEAALEERQRIAREFHDTLEQELAGISLRLDALATRAIDEKGRHLIEASRNLVSRIQSETRDLISDLRDPLELSGDIVAVLSAVAERLSTDSGAEVRVVARAPGLKLPATATHDLRMIARESVNNALTHGGATRVTIRLEADAARIVLAIQDNGRGFDVAAANGKRGHFGCAGIRERCRKLDATVTWQSAPGQGAKVEVSIPISRKDSDNGGAVPSPRGLAPAFVSGPRGEGTAPPRA